MTNSDAIRRAKEVADQNRWTWIGDGIARRLGLFSRILVARGRQTWKVMSHGGKGAKVTVYIDDATGGIVKAMYEPR